MRRRPLVLRLASENKTCTMRFTRGPIKSIRCHLIAPDACETRSTDNGHCTSGDRGSIHGQVEGARRGAEPDREGVRQGLDHAARPGIGAGRDRDGADRLARPRYRARHRRTAAGPDHGDLRSRIVGQDDAGAARHRRSAKGRRHLRVHRRRACAGPDLRPQARRQPRRSSHLAARHRRAGAGNRRHTGALRRDRHSRRRFGGGADATRRDRGRNGRPAAGPAGAADEPGAEKAHRVHLPLQHHGHFHQPDPR